MMANKVAASPPVVEESAVAAPTAGRHPAQPDQTTTPTHSPAVVTYDPLPHEKVCDIPHISTPGIAS